MGPSGDLVVGGGVDSKGEAIVTMADHAVTAGPTSFDIAGTSVTAGGPDVTIPVTAVRLDKSGNLVIGARMMELPLCQQLSMLRARLLSD